MWAAIKAFFTIALYNPLFNLLVLLYEYVTFHDLGLAIIVLTIVIRVILFPLFYKFFKHQTVMQKLQPELARIKSEHKGNREKQAEAMMALWKENQVSPFTPMLLMLVQIPVLLIIFHIFKIGFAEVAFSHLYSFVPHPAEINNMFLSLIDVTKPSIIIVLLASAAQYLQAKMSLPAPSKDLEVNRATAMSRQMAFIGPVITFLVLRSLSAAIGLYWLTTSVFSIGQQYFINKQLYGQRNTQA